jgi:hypothetical protein
MLGMYMTIIPINYVNSYEGNLNTNMKGTSYVYFGTHDRHQMWCHSGCDWLNMMQDFCGEGIMWSRIGNQELVCVTDMLHANTITEDGLTEQVRMWRIGLVVGNCIHPTYYVWSVLGK